MIRKLRENLGNSFFAACQVKSQLRQRTERIQGRDGDITIAVFHELKQDLRRRAGGFVAKRFCTSRLPGLISLPDQLRKLSPIVRNKSRGQRRCNADALVRPVVSAQLRAKKNIQVPDNAADLTW